MNRRELLLLLGSAVATPRALRAQQKPVPVIGFLSVGSPGPLVGAFRQGLSETGWVEGDNVAIEYRWADGRYDQLSGLPADLVSRKVDVNRDHGRRCFGIGGEERDLDDPDRLFGCRSRRVRAGRKPRPAGSQSHRLQHPQHRADAQAARALTELVPQARGITLLVTPNEPRTEGLVRDMQEAARVKGIELQILKAGDEREIDTAFATLVQLQASALVLGPDSFLNSRREQIVALASRHAVPAISAWRELTAAGGLISYGPNIAALCRETGIYAGRILKGEKPADLPVQRPTRFELVINLKTARALGLTVPPRMLDLADEVIE